MRMGNEAPRWSRLLAATALLLAMMLAGCRGSGSTSSSQTSQAGPATAGAPKLGGIANMPQRDDPPLGWDPMRTGTITLMNVSQPIFGEGNLLKQCADDGTKLCPGLAESWQGNDDGSVWTFKIRNNVYWHDGVQFTADDAKWWMDLSAFGAESQGKKRRPANWDWASFVKQVEAPDATTLRVTLKSPVRIFDALLGTDDVEIAHPKHLMQPLIDQGKVDVAPIDVKFVGLGPFKLDQYQQGSIIKVRKFEKYWEKDKQGRQLPYLDGIDFYIIKDPTAMDTAFRSGRLDATARGSGFQLTPERESAILESLGKDKVFIAKMGQSSPWTVAFNSLRPGPFQDQRVRQAVSLWLDRQALVKLTFGGFGRPIGMFDSNWPWANPDILKQPGWNPDTKQQDRQRAKQLLTEAGFPNGFKAEFMCRQLWSFVCEPIVGEMKEMGLQVDLQIVDDATRQSRYLAGQFEVSLSGPTLANPSQYAQFVGAVSKNPTSEMKHDDPKVTDFFDRLATAKTEQERVKTAQEMERYMAFEKVYGAWLYTEEGHQAYRSYVKGVAIPADNYRRNLGFAAMWLDK